jgi:fermentation-respiration switch protein FrsA (DUF1100 family)
MPGASHGHTAPTGRRRRAGRTGSPACPSASCSPSTPRSGRTGSPALFIHGRRDDFCSPSAADAIYQRAQTADKEFLWLDTTNHIDLYDNPAYVDPAAARLTGWLTERL